MRPQSLLVLSFALVSSAKQKYELNSGEIQLLDTSEVHKAHAPEDGKPIVGRMLTRDLFARQYCSNPGENVICGAGCCANTDSCCESVSCGDPTQRICCLGGHQCPIGGDCCTDGNCCWAGTYCVKNLNTGAIGCRSYSGSGGGGSGGGGVSSSIALTTPTITTPPTPSTTTPPAPSSTYFTCDNSGYSPCADQKFCCPYGDYCYYDKAGNPKCWDGSYYYWYYYFYWYYEEYTTTLWFTTYTTFYLGDDYSTVFSLPSTPPTPTVAPPTRLAIVPPSDTGDLGGGSFPTATGGPNAAGNLPDGGSDFSTPTIPSATLLATYTGEGGALASDATKSGGGAVETLASTGSGSGGSLSASGAVRRIELLWGREAVLGTIGVVGVFLGAVLL